MLTHDQLIVTSVEAAHLPHVLAWLTERHANAVAELKQSVEARRLDDAQYEAMERDQLEDLMRLVQEQIVVCQPQPSDIVLIPAALS